VKSGRRENDRTPEDAGAFRGASTKPATGKILRVDRRMNDN
jgi:hypothetical protein